MNAMNAMNAMKSILVVLVETAGYATEELQNQLYDAGMSVSPLSYSSPRVRGLVAQIEMPKGGASLPFVMFVSDGKVIYVSDVCPTAEEISSELKRFTGEQPTADPRLLIVGESGNFVPRQPSEHRTVIVPD